MNAINQPYYLQNTYTKTFNLYSFREAVKNAYMNKFENLFISKFSFNGDNDFDVKAQELFFRTIFRLGNVALLIQSDNTRGIYRYWPIPHNNKPAVKMNGVVSQAVVFPAWKNFQGGLTFDEWIEWTPKEKLNVKENHTKNVVFFQSFIGEDYQQQQGMKKMLEVFIDELVNRHLNSNYASVLASGKFAIAGSETIKINVAKDLYTPGGVIQLEGERDGMTQGQDITADLSKNFVMLQGLEKIDPTKFLDNIIQYQEMIYRLFGFKVNQHFKKERLITAEVDNENQDLMGYDFRLKQALNVFIADYEKAVGKKLILVDNISALSNTEPTPEKEPEKQGVETDDS